MRCKRFPEAGEMFEYASKTVSYAKELTSVSLCYSQKNGFHTPLSRLLLNSVHAVSCLVTVVCSLVCCCSAPWYGHALPRVTLIKIMCVHYLHHQGKPARPIQTISHTPRAPGLINKFDLPRSIFAPSLSPPKVQPPSKAPILQC